MGRPPDATKLAPSEAKALRDLLRRGKDQYGLTWRLVGDHAGYSEKSVRNYIDASHPLPSHVAKALLRSVLDCNQARDWRRLNCCVDHQTGEAASCGRVGTDGLPQPCDPWYAEALSWGLSASWLFQRQPLVPAIIDPLAYDALADELAPFICRSAGLGQVKREAVAKAIRSFLNRNGERLAIDGLRLFAWRAQEIITSQDLRERFAFDSDLFAKSDTATLLRFAQDAMKSVVAGLFKHTIRRQLEPAKMTNKKISEIRDAAFADALNESRGKLE